MLFHAIVSFRAASNYTFDLLFTTYTSPFLHHVEVSGFTLNTLYYYRVGSSAGWSQIFTVTSHPGVGPDIPFYFGVIGDLGQTANSNETVQHMLAQPRIQCILHAGDLSYSDDDEDKYGAKADAEWRTYQNMIQPLSARIPWHTAPGNHEIENPFNPFVSYKARYRMPFNASDALQEGSLWWSMSVASAHIVFLSSFSDFSASSSQYKWLQRDLQSVDRSVTPWLLVFLHAPWYNSNHDHQGSGDAMKSSMEKLFVQYGVDMVFAGHVHAYERNKRIVQGAVNETGPMYITIGDGGNREGLAGDWMQPQPEWSAYRQAEFGHGELAIVNSTAMFWSWHRDADTEEQVTDSVWVSRTA